MWFAARPMTCGEADSRDAQATGHALPAATCARAEGEAHQFSAAGMLLWRADAGAGVARKELDEARWHGSRGAAAAEMTLSSSRVAGAITPRYYLFTLPGHSL